MTWSRGPDERTNTEEIGYWKYEGSIHIIVLRFGMSRYEGIEVLLLPQRWTRTLEWSFFHFYSLNIYITIVPSYPYFSHVYSFTQVVLLYGTPSLLIHLENCLPSIVSSKTPSAWSFPWFHQEELWFLVPMWQFGFVGTSITVIFNSMLWSWSFLIYNEFLDKQVYTASFPVLNVL